MGRPSPPPPIPKKVTSKEPLEFQSGIFQFESTPEIKRPVHIQPASPVALPDSPKLFPDQPPLHRLDRTRNFKTMTIKPKTENPQNQTSNFRTMKTVNTRKSVQQARNKLDMELVTDLVDIISMIEDRKKNKAENRYV